MPRRAVVLAHAQRPAGEHRGQHHVAFVEDLVQPHGVLGRGDARRVGQPARDRRADPGDALDAARIALAVADLDRQVPEAAHEAREDAVAERQAPVQLALDDLVAELAQQRRGGLHAPTLLGVDLHAQRRQPDGDRDPQLPGVGARRPR